MHDLDRNEARLRGTYDFPFEFHLERDIQKATDDAVKHLDAMTANKEKELLEV